MKLELAVIATILAFAGVFFYISSTGEHEWGGADDQSERVIDELTGGTYQPWFHSVWEPPSAEIESFLFALQAAIGSLIIGYFLGYYRAAMKIRSKSTQAAEEREGSNA